MSSFEDEGYGMMVRSGHVFLYRRDEPVGTTIMLEDRRDMIYVLRGNIVHPGASGWLSKSKDEEIFASDVHVYDEENDSLKRIGRRLNQPSDGFDEQVDEAQVESHASEFQYGVEHLYSREIP